MRLPALLLLALAASAPVRGADCPLRMIEPRLDDLADAARRLAPGDLDAALGADDRRTHDLAVAAAWYAARANGDTEARTRTTAELFEIWDRHRPAGRLMRVVAAGLAEEGWPAPAPADVDRRLARLGDRDAVLARAGAVANAEDVPDALLREALRGVTVMVVRQDGEALALAGTLLERLGEDFAAAETVLFRAELGEASALRELAARYRALDAEACAERADLVHRLFGAP